MVALRADAGLHVPALVASAANRSFRTGVQAGIWTAIAIIPINYAVGLAEGMRQYAVSGVWTFAGDISSAGFNLGFTFMTLLAVPAIGFPFAVLSGSTWTASHDAPSAVATV